MIRDSVKRLECLIILQSEDNILNMNSLITVNKSYLVNIMDLISDENEFTDFERRMHSIE